MKKLFCWFLGHKWFDASWIDRTFAVTSYWCERCGEDGAFQLHYNFRPALAA